MTSIVLKSAGIIFVYVNIICLLAVIKKNNGIMDAAWGPGFVLLAWLVMVPGGFVDGRQILMASLVSVWGIRLSAHILVRTAGKGEDFRYRTWRETWGRWFPVRSYLQIFILQGVLMLVIAMPILVVNARPGVPLGLLDMTGIGVWLVGFFFEAVGDMQLLLFTKKSANKGLLMRSGLWRYTRHPNYFGEATSWWGLFFIALAAPGGWSAVVSPVTIAALLLFVSGIPMLEAKYKDRPDFQEYQKETSAFLPWFPRKK